MFWCPQHLCSGIVSLRPFCRGPEHYKTCCCGCRRIFPLKKMEAKAGKGFSQTLRWIWQETQRGWAFIPGLCSTALFTPWAVQLGGNQSSVQNQCVPGRGSSLHSLAQAQTAATAGAASRPEATRKRDGRQGVAQQAALGGHTLLSHLLITSPNSYCRS